MAYAVAAVNQKVLRTYTRSGGDNVEWPFEKTVIVPAAGNEDPSIHAWVDARFATDIMAEHAFFFALLMPPELAAVERMESLRFAEIFGTLHRQIDRAAPPERSGLKTFTSRVLEQMKRVTDFKARLGDAQRSGKLRSLAWPLFFDHTRHEAERWTRRLETLARGEWEFDRAEVTKFWSNIMDEHARFVAHLLDPAENELIDKAMKTSRVFADLHDGGIAEVASPVGRAGVNRFRVQNPEMDAVLSAAETILEFKTKTVRDIEAARIKSIIDPRLADHVRREAQKFVDELKRAV